MYQTFHIKVQIINRLYRYLSILKKAAVQPETVQQPLRIYGIKGIDVIASTVYLSNTLTSEEFTTPS